MFETAIEMWSFLAERSLTALLDASLKSSLLLLAALALCLVLRRRSAALRHVVWSMAIAGALALPALSMLAPPIELALPVVASPFSEAAAGEAPAAEEAARAASPHTSPTPAARPQAAVDPTPPTATASVMHETGPAGSTEAARSPGIAAALEAGASGGAAPSEAAPPAGRTAASLTASLMAVWAAGALGVLAVLALGMLRLAWLARRAQRIASGPLHRIARRLSLRLGISSEPVLLRGDASAIPMTWGLRRAHVLLPAGAEAWGRERIEAVLLHELGHVGRHDYAAQVAAHVACALYWFNPLVWIAAHRMRIEREHACDDLVVSAGHEAGRYADDLLRLARTFRPSGQKVAVALAIARPDRFRERLLAILDDGRSRHPLTRRGIVGAAVPTLAATLALAALTPVPGRAEAAPPSDDERPAREDVRAGDGMPLGLQERLSAGRASEGRGAVTGPGADDRISFRLVPIALQQASVLCGPGDGEARRRASMTNDGVRTIESEYGACRSSVRIEGDLEFNDDFTALERMSPGSLLRIEVRRGGSDRRLEARPEAGGRPGLRWTIDGQERPVDAAAREWLAGALLDLFRSSSYMAEERVAAIIAREGPEGVLAEVDLMLADHARASYLAILLERGELSGLQVRRVIDLAHDTIESDHSLGEVLLAAARDYDFDAPTRAAFLRAATAVDSDHTQGRIFRAALARGDLSQENLEAMLDAAAESIESDHTLGELLVELATRYPLERGLRRPFLRAAATIESDHTAGRVYGVLLDQDGLDANELSGVLEAATRIGSDHTLGELLRGVAAGHDLADETLRTAFLRAARTIGSDHTRAEVYRRALEIEGLDQADLATILSDAASLGSDHELAALLSEVAARGISGSELQRAYLEAAADIGSDHAKTGALLAFLEMDGLGEAERVELLVASRTIDSDHSLSELLIAFAERFPVEGAVRDAFLATLDTVESRHARGRVSSALIGG